MHYPPGASLKGADMFGPKTVVYKLNDFEIGATGPEQLQFVLREGRHTAVVEMTSDSARALIFGLQHWLAVADDKARW